MRDEVWLGVVLSFVGLEIWALLDPEESRTASEVVRQAAGISPRKPWRPVGAAVIIGFSLWLTVHLLCDPEADNGRHQSQ